MLPSRRGAATWAVTTLRRGLFIAPGAIIFAVYVVIPIFQSFWLSLFDWDGITVEKQFFSLANYEQLFQDEQFGHIIMPQLRPATFIAVVITVVGALRSFDLVQVMTDGGPYGSSSILAYFMFQQSITNFRMGYGTAIAMVLFLIMSVFIAFFLWRMIRTEEH